MRPTPYDVVFGPGADERFARIRESLAGSGRDPHDADAFVLDREAAGVLRELVPDEGVGPAVTEHLALLHHVYLYWAEGGWLLSLSREAARALLQGGPPGAGAESPAGAPRAFYLQFPERLVWAELGEGEPHQPLDGCFVRPWPGGGCFVLGIFGLHPGRDGFSVVSADGYPDEAPRRDSGQAPFAPVLPGGEAAGLFSIVGEEELLDLARRATTLAARAVTEAGPDRRPHVAVAVGGP